MNKRHVKISLGLRKDYFIQFINEKNEVETSWNFTCLDNALQLINDYVSGVLNYPVTIEEVFQRKKDLEKQGWTQKDFAAALKKELTD